MSGLRFVALAIVVVMLAGCFAVPGINIIGSGPVVTKELDLSGFDKVAVSSAFQAEIARSDNYGVTVTVNENVLDYLDVTVSGGTLRIGLKSNTSVSGIPTLKAQVTMPQLTGLDLSGASRTTLEGFSSEKSLDAGVSGASTLRGDITSGDASVEASGASKVTLQGSAQDLKVRASGASNVDLGGFASQDTVVDASGASHVTVNPSGQLTGEASGASSVRYVGEPDRVQVNTSGASSVGKK